MILKTTHSKTFIDKFKLVLKELYNYEEYMDFMIVPSIMGKKTLSYLPLLNYSDRLYSDIDDLLELAKDNHYQIRVLNSEYNNFKEDDTVTMRLDISSLNKETVFKEFIKSKCRNQIRKSQKSNLYIEFGKNKNLIDDFYNLFSTTMHRYGTPAFNKRLFELIVEKLNANIFVVYKEDIAISALILIEDEDISFVPWAASENQFSKYCPSHLMYFEAINYSIDNGRKIFDFGRSNYAGNTYKFKSQWGATPVKIDILKSNRENIYNKYSYASKIWQKLPKKLVDFAGAKLCKYLEDL